MPIGRCPGCGAENDLQLDLCFSCGQALSGVGPGSVVGDRFELLVEVGRGGMGWVYRAHDRLLDEEVGIKILRLGGADDVQLAARFRREIRLARRVSHPNVCRIFEYGEDDQLRYITMEFVDGVDLLSALKRRQAGLPLDEAFGVALGIASGLEAVHAEGIVHRDLKSANVMIDARGAARLLDFGIARDATPRSRSRLTLPGLVIGTPEYMSPEQCRGLTPDHRSDVYSCAIVVYEIFTGRVPFQGQSSMDTVILQLEKPPPLEDAVAAGLPDALIGPLSVALSKERADRHASVSEFAEALREARCKIDVKGSGVVRSIPSNERRRDRRLEIPVSCRIRFEDLVGEPSEEWTVTDNISRGGARVKTAQLHLSEGDLLRLEEVSGPFQVRAEVRQNRAADDGVRRLHLKFVDHAAPDRLVGAGDAA